MNFWVQFVAIKTYVSVYALAGKATKAGSKIQELQINYIGYTGGVLYLGPLRSMYTMYEWMWL